MSKPNWVDYANLGANITNVAVNTAQLHTLYEVNTQLAQLAQIEANRERRHQLENNLRQFVFDEETKLHQLRGRSDISPPVFWVSAHIIQHNLESVPVTAASFQEFVDKDRVRKFTTDLLAAIHQCESRLNSDQLNRARLALKYIFERSSLDELIEMQTQIEFLSNTDAQYEELGKELNKKKLRSGLGCLPILLFVCPLIMITTWVFEIGIEGILDDFFVLLLLVVWLILGLWWYIRSKPNAALVSQHERLQAQRSEATKKLPSSAHQNELIAQFGQGLTLQQLLDLKNDRETKLPMLLRWP